MVLHHALADAKVLLKQGEQGELVLVGSMARGPWFGSADLDSEYWKGSLVLIPSCAQLNLTTCIFN